MYTGALNSVFSRRMLRSLCSTTSAIGVSDDVIRLLTAWGCTTLGDGLSSLYRYLQRSHRNEYIYKSALFNKIILGIHSPNTSTAFEELSIADSIADFVVVNGVGTVYEIKTDLDTTKRLEAQIADYYTAFDRVVVVCGQGMAEDLLGRYSDSPLGIYELTQRGTIRRHKEPEGVQDDLSPVSMLGMLRKAERKEILCELGSPVPDVAPVYFSRACLEELERLPIEHVHKAFLKVLKRRGAEVDARAVRNLPKELRLPGYMARITLDQTETALEKLARPLAI